MVSIGLAERNLSLLRICSNHFEGGKKTWLNNVPTIGPKTIKPTPTKERAKVRCREKEKFPIPGPKKSKNAVKAK